MRILNLEPDRYSPAALALLQQAGEVENGPLTRLELLARLPEFEVLIVRLAHAIDRQALERGRRLRIVVSATTGLDHIDLAAAQMLGVRVLSLRGETEFLRSIPATAEHTWGLLLALVRQIPAALASVQAGEWQRDRFRGHDLAGQRLGILGLGRIGEKVARYGLAFGMRVLAYDPYRWPDLQAFPELAAVERCASQAELLPQSDVFSIHVPLNGETQGLIGAAELALLPVGARLINTARGEVLDEAALLAALTGIRLPPSPLPEQPLSTKGEGEPRLAGAALDVLCDERGPALQASALMAYAREHANLIITPHIGGATVESMAATEIFMAQKLLKELAGAQSV